MQKVLLLGISGVGKSSVVVALAGRGYKAVDADTAEWCEWVAVADGVDEFGSTVEPERDWVWREDRMRNLLATEDAPILFVAGTPTNVWKFFPQFDRIVLLSAPAPVIVERLETRTANLYGKEPHELTRILSLKQEVEPRLRKVADCEIDTSVPLDEVVGSLLRLVA